jgi:hypothetical protein
MTTTARVKKADVMLSERAEFVAAAFAATTNSARESKHLHFLVPLRKFSGGSPDTLPLSPGCGPPASRTLPSPSLHFLSRGAPLHQSNPCS